MRITRWREERRRSESNRRIEVLQTSALPLGYGARPSKVTKSRRFLNPPGTLGQHFVVERHLITAHRTPVGGIEREHHRRAAQFAQRGRCAISGDELEIRGLLALQRDSM